MNERKILNANNGHIFTNGTDYGTEIWLEEGNNGEDYHEIPLEEYHAMLESEEATEEDYRNALKDMGVNV